MEEGHQNRRNMETVMGGSTEGIWEDWPEDENQRGRQDSGLKIDRETLGKRTCECVFYLSTGLGFLCRNQREVIMG